MASQTPTARRSRGFLRVPPGATLAGGGTAVAALVAALVVGILGMHALASHGTPAAPAAAAAWSVTGMTGMGSGESAHKAAMASGDSHNTHPHDVAAARSKSEATSASGHDVTSMVMLCVVMLAVAALTLVVLLVVGILRPLPAAFGPAAVRQRTSQWIRGTGPPPEWHFSVIRC